MVVLVGGTPPRGVPHRGVPPLGIRGGPQGGPPQGESPRAVGKALWSDAWDKEGEIHLWLHLLNHYMISRLFRNNGNNDDA